MQTTLQMLIEWLKEENEICPIYKRLDPEFQIRIKATELLEKEREIIEKAYSVGDDDGTSIKNGEQPEYYGASDYFTKTFTDKND